MRKVALPKLLPLIYRSHSWEKLDKEERNLNFTKIAKTKPNWEGFLIPKKKKNKKRKKKKRATGKNEATYYYTA